MRKTTRMAAYTVGAVVVAGALAAQTAALVGANRDNRRLGSELETANARVAQVEGQRDAYRKQLIQHGNPEGWTLNGDGLGGAWYERQNSNGLGDVWTECFQ